MYFVMAAWANTWMLQRPRTRHPQYLVALEFNVVQFCPEAESKFRGLENWTVSQKLLQNYNHPHYLLGWPRSSFRLFQMMLWKNPDEFFGQGDIAKYFIQGEPRPLVPYMYWQDQPELLNHQVLEDKSHCSWCQRIHPIANSLLFPLHQLLLHKV